ncbi:MAG: RHS repeat-associated core domain-containing protein, partial [Cyclobacteriaceae bacterium]
KKFCLKATRDGFNGKERDRNMGTSLVYDYGFRIYNPSIGKFLSVDPLKDSYPELTPYQFASNNPIDGVDVDGLEYLNKDEARISVTLGTVFIRLETFSDVFQRQFRAKFPEYGLVQVGDDGIGFGDGQVNTIITTDFLGKAKPPANFGRPSEIVQAHGKTTNIKKYTAPNVLKLVPVRKNGERDLRYNLGSGREIISTPSPRLGRPGVGFVLVLNVATFALETQLSMTIKEDLTELNKQLKDGPVAVSEGIFENEVVMMRSVLNQSVSDVQEALSTPGFIPEDFNLNIQSLSDVINFVLFGGEGNESEEVKKIGNKIINEISIKNQRKSKK